MTVDPTFPLLGAILQIVGNWPAAGVQVGVGVGVEPSTVYVDDCAEPFAVVTVIGPVSAPLGTVTVIFVAVKLPDAAALPVKIIESGGTNPEPFITTVEPTEPEFGSMLVIVGGAAFAAERTAATEEPAEIIRS